MNEASEYENCAKNLIRSKQVTVFMDYIHLKPDINRIIQAFIKVSVEMKRYEVSC